MSDSQICAIVVESGAHILIFRCSTRLFRVVRYPWAERLWPVLNHNIDWEVCERPPKSVRPVLNSLLEWRYGSDRRQRHGRW